MPLDKAEYKDTYECPVYLNKVRNRETYVWSFNVKTREPASKWILAGVAMLLANDQWADFSSILDLIFQFYYLVCKGDKWNTNLLNS